MNKTIPLMALTACLGCASPQKPVLNPGEINPNVAMPVVDLGKGYPAFSVKTIPPSLMVEQETPVGVIADKLYNRLKTKTRHRSHEFTPVEFTDKAAGTQFTVGIRPGLNKAGLTFFLSGPGSDSDFFMAIDNYPLGSLDHAVCLNGNLPVDNPVVNSVYETLLRRSYQHIQKTAWNEWRLSATITDFELNKAFKNIFDYIHSQNTN